MTYVPTGVRPCERIQINMVGRGNSGSGGVRVEGSEGEAVGEQRGQEENGEDEDHVAGLFGDFSEDEPGEREQEPHRDQRHPEEVPPPPNIHLPIAPSQEDWDEHFRTHINFRDWCPVCVEARG